MPGRPRAASYADRVRPTTLRRLAAAYLVVQGVGVLAWWVLLLTVPASRSLFTATGAPDAVLLAFLVGDVVLVGVGSLVAAVGVARAARWAWPVLLAHAATAVYAGLYCVSLPLFAGGSGWVAAVAMTPVLVVPAVLAGLLRPRVGRA
jgi:hypothetical protein